jgi:hypothetical protein
MNIYNLSNYVIIFLIYYFKPLTFLLYIYFIRLMLILRVMETRIAMIL